MQCEGIGITMFNGLLIRHVGYGFCNLSVTFIFLSAYY